MSAVDCIRVAVDFVHEEIILESKDVHGWVWSMPLFEQVALRRHWKIPTLCGVLESLLNEFGGNPGEIWFERKVITFVRGMDPWSCRCFQTVRFDVHIIGLDTPHGFL